jgi:hypothetical protein
MLNMREQLADKAWSRHAQHARAARGQGLDVGMLNVSVQLADKDGQGAGMPREQLLNKDDASMLNVCEQLADKDDAGMLNMCEQLADKDDAGMLNMCEQLADKDELCGQVVLRSSRP